MMGKPNYRIATNTAYEALIRTEHCSLPIDVEKIIQSYPDIQLYSYYKACIELGFDMELLQLESELGFTIITKGRYFILYNSEQPHKVTRFTLAHELGHYLLCHDKDNEKSDKEANCFARNFLSPVTVAKEFNLVDSLAYRKCFNISLQAADVAIEMAKTDYYYIDNANYNAMKNKINHEQVYFI